MNCENRNVEMTFKNHSRSSTVVPISTAYIISC